MADTAYNYPHRSDVRLPPYNMTAGASCRTLHFAQQTSIFDAKPLRFYLPMRIGNVADAHRPRCRCASTARLMGIGK